MKRIILLVFGAMLFLGSLTAASAITLSLIPATQTATPGETITLDLVVDGLGDFAPVSLGAFDVFIDYDPSALTFAGVTLGSLLGDPALGEALDSSMGDSGGVVNVSVTTFLELDAGSCVFCIPPFLDAIQPGSFSLASLDFLVGALPAGSSTTVMVSSSSIVLGDGFGSPVTPDLVTGAGITILASDPGPIGLPAPATWLLLGGAMLGLLISREMPGARLRC